MRAMFFAAVMIIVVPTLAEAQIQFNFGPPPRRVDYFKKEIGKTETQMKELLGGKAFEKSKYKNKKSGKTLTYNQLPKFERDLLQLEAMESFEEYIKGIGTEWQEIADKLKKVDGEVLSDDDSAVVNRTDVLHYKEKIVAMRLAFAKEYETTAKAFFAAHVSRFSREEIDSYLARIAKMTKENK